MLSSRRSTGCWNQPRLQGVDFAAAWDGAPAPIPCAQPCPCSIATNERREKTFEERNKTMDCT